MHRTLPAMALVLALSVTGCGGDDDAAAAQAISDSIVKSSSKSSSQFLSMKRKDADCIGDGLVDKIGTAKLQKYGLLTEDMKPKEDISNVKMSAGDAEAATGVLFGCTDVEAMMESAIGKSRTVSKQAKTCVNKTLTESSLRPMFTLIFQGKQDEAAKALTEPIMNCAMSGGG